MSAESTDPADAKVPGDFSRWSLDRIRREERERAAQYRGLSAAWHVWRADYGVAFVLFFLAAVISLVYLRGDLGGSFVYDDSYITQRFAQNLLRYHRFTFDGGPSGAGATSPLHVILIALVSLVTGRTDVATFVLGVLSLAGAAIFAYYWSREVTGSRRVAAVSGLLLVTSGWMIFDALSGMETMLFIALILLTLFLFEKRSIWFGLPAALSVMTRPDAWFFAAGVAGYGIVSAMRHAPSGTRTWAGFAAGSLAVFAGSLAPYLILNYFGTGSLLPNTALAKTYFFGEIGLPLKTKIDWTWSCLKFFYAGIITPWPWLIVLGLVFARRFWTRFYVPISLVVFLLAYLLLFPGSLRHYWGRYQHIFIPAALLAVAEGSYVLVRLVRRGLERPAGSGFRIAHAGLALGILIAGMLGVNQYRSLRDGYAKFVGSVKSIENVGSDVARFVRSHSRKGDLVATHDIGVLAYYSDRPILDLVGLVNPEVQQYYRNPETGKLIPVYQRQVLGYILDAEPKFLVIFDFWKMFLNFDPDKLPQYFTFLGESKPPYPFTSGGYRIYAVQAAEEP